MAGSMSLDETGGAPDGAPRHSTEHSTEHSTDQGTNLRMKYINRVVAGVFGGLGVIVIYLTTTFQATLITDRYLGAAFFPRFIAVLMIGFAVVLWWMKPRPVSDSGNDTEPFYTPRMKTPAAAVILLLLYAVVLPYAGFLISTAVCFILLLVLLGSRVWWYYLFAVIFTGALFYVFYELFRVQLPRGVLF
jgi:putative tricarboxylic transport membrane protein